MTFRTYSGASQPTDVFLLSCPHRILDTPEVDSEPQDPPDAHGVAGQERDQGLAEEVADPHGLEAGRKGTVLVKHAEDGTQAVSRDGKAGNEDRDDGDRNNAAQIAEMHEGATDVDLRRNEPDQEAAQRQFYRRQQQVPQGRRGHGGEHLNHEMPMIG